MSPPGAGFTVLLLHAFPLDAGMWNETRQELGEEPATAAPTLPPAGGGRALSGWAAAVLRLVEGDLVPVGVSMGGYLAFELWRQAPERISALVLSDTRAGSETDEGRVGRERTIELIRARGAAGLWEEMEPKLFSPAADPEMVERARSVALARDPDDLVACVEAIRDRPDSRPTLPTIDVPTLVLVGERDELTPPPEAAAIASGIPGAKLVSIPESGHLPPLERPGAFLASLRAHLAEVGA
jgi:3-oxoadipate enol-lactonase